MKPCAIRSIALTASLLATASASALELPADRANHFDYDYVEGAWADLEDGLDGFSFGFSHDLRKNIAVTGGLLSASENNADFDLLHVGAAYHFKSLNMTDTDVIFHGSLVRSKAKVSGFGFSASDSDTGLRIGAKMRVDLQPGVEVFGDISLTTADEAGDSDILITPGLAIEFTPELDGVVSYEASDREWLHIGLRYYS